MILITHFGVNMLLSSADGPRRICSACFRWNKAVWTRWTCGWQTPSSCPSRWRMRASHRSCREYWRYVCTTFSCKDRKQIRLLQTFFWFMPTDFWIWYWSLCCPLSVRWRTSAVHWQFHRAAGMFCPSSCSAGRCLSTSCPLWVWTPAWDKTCTFLSTSTLVLSRWNTSSSVEIQVDKLSAIK